MSRVFVFISLLVATSVFLIPVHAAQASLSQSIMPNMVFSLLKSNYLYWCGVLGLGFWCQINSNKGRFTTFLMTIVAFFIACFLHINKTSLPFSIYLHLIPFLLIGGLIIFSISVSGIIEVIVSVIVVVILTYYKIPNGLGFERFWASSLMSFASLFVLFYAGSGFSQMIKTSCSDNIIKFIGVLIVAIGFLPFLT